MRTEQLLPPPAGLTAELGAWCAQQPAAQGVADAVAAIAGAGATLSRVIAAGAAVPARAAAVNASGDDQKPLDVYAEGLFVAALAGLDVAAVCSEESERPVPLTPGGSVLVTLDPVDGSSNIDVNAPVGTIFSVLPCRGGDVEAAALQSGRSQLAAGMIVYGPSTMLVLTLGDGTDVYVLDPETRQFTLVRRRVQLPADAQEYAVNASNARHWGPGIRTYINDLVSGSIGPRGRDFNMRWYAALVADAYRILIRGGIFLYPADERPQYRDGRIRLVYEANPVAMLCEQAGGLATNGVDSILDQQPASLHQRTPLVFGSRTKVERVRRYLADPSDSHEHSPLFNERGLFRV